MNAPSRHRSSPLPAPVEFAWGMRGRICDLPGYMLDQLVELASGHKRRLPGVRAAQRRINGGAR